MSRSSYAQQTVLQPRGALQPAPLIGSEVFRDEFTGTAGLLITARAPDVGTNWTKQFGLSNYQLDGLGGAPKDVASDDAHYLQGPLMPSADQEASLVFSAGLGDGELCVVLRGLDAGASFDGYYVRWFVPFGVNDGAVDLLTYTAGALGPTLAYTGAAYPALGTQGTLRVTMVGSVIKVYTQGTLRITYVDPAPKTQAGQAGVFSFAGSGAATLLSFSSRSLLVPTLTLPMFQGAY